MHRFFAHSAGISSEKIKINDKEQVHHLKNVLRINLKEEVAVFDEKANGYLCSVDSLGQEVLLSIIKKLTVQGSPGSFKLAVACAIPKDSRMDDIVDKLTQLGAERIVPLLSERVVVKLDKEKGSSRVKRWQRIALSAAKQSQRFTVPAVDEIKDFKGAVLDAKAYELKLLPTLGFSKRKPLKEVLKDKKYKSVYLLIGPEGDFSEKEVALAMENGFVPVTLGELVLRVETAAVAAASFIRFYGHENR